MPILEDVKAYAERRTGVLRPKPAILTTLVRNRTPRQFRFRDDGETPNNSWPLLIYRSAVRLDDAFDPAAIFEDLFERHGWKRSWRDGMYDWLHFHSNTHEVLGVARGWLRARFGGAHGRVLRVQAGDVIVLPAGTGHYREHASTDLMIVGAYPGARRYDECETHDTDDKRRTRIRRVPLPKKDPVHGAEGPLFDAWKARR